MSDMGALVMTRVFANVKWIMVAAALLAFASDASACHHRRRGGCCNASGYAGGGCGGYANYGYQQAPQSYNKSMVQAPAPGKSMGPSSGMNSGPRSNQSV